jgi:hypothetical protein
MNATAARLAVAAAASALALAACTGSGTVPDKAGGGEPLITLRLGSADASDNPTALRDGGARIGAGNVCHIWAFLIAWSERSLRPQLNQESVGYRRYEGPTRYMATTSIAPTSTPAKPGTATFWEIACT